MEKKQIKGRQLIDAEIEVTYEAGPEVFKTKGLFKGAQPMFGIDEWFIIVRIKDDVDKAIPVSRIIDLTVLKAESFELKKDSEMIYHG
jgi:hypothetical protein